MELKKEAIAEYKYVLTLSEKEKNHLYEVCDSAKFDMSGFTLSERQFLTRICDLLKEQERLSQSA